MKFIYTADRGGIFYGKEVVPEETYEFFGEMKRLASKSSNFEAVEKPKTSEFQKKKAKK